MTITDLLRGEYNNNLVKNTEYEPALLDVSSVKGVLFGFPERIMRKGCKKEFLFLPEGIILPHTIEAYMENDSKLDQITNYYRLDDGYINIFKTPIYFREKDVVKIYAFDTDRFRAIMHGASTVPDITHDNVFEFLDEMDEKYRPKSK